MLRIKLETPASGVNGLKPLPVAVEMLGLITMPLRIGGAVGAGNEGTAERAGAGGADMLVLDSALDIPVEGARRLLAEAPVDLDALVRDAQRRVLAQGQKHRLAEADGGLGWRG
jgi:hypothetical protein